MATYVFFVERKVYILTRKLDRNEEEQIRPDLTLQNIIDDRQIKKKGW